MKMIVDEDIIMDIQKHFKDITVMMIKKFDNLETALFCASLITSTVNSINEEWENMENESQDDDSSVSC